VLKNAQCHRLCIISAPTLGLNCNKFASTSYQNAYWTVCTDDLAIDALVIRSIGQGKRARTDTNFVSFPTNLAGSICITMTSGNSSGVAHDEPVT
jgi:hypothetical protein